MTAPRYLGFVPEDVYLQIQHDLGEAARLHADSLRRLYEIKKAWAERTSAEQPRKQGACRPSTRKPALLSTEKPTSPAAHQGTGSESISTALVGTKP